MEVWSFPAAGSRIWKLNLYLAGLCMVIAVQRVAALKPRPYGHFLTPSELRNISSVDCLKAKQGDPSIECLNVAAPSQSASLQLPGQTNVGNYPSYKDDVCNSLGEYFCDPAGVLSAEQRVKVTQELARLRKEHPVVCHGLQSDKVDGDRYQPFYLGVALAQDWPSSETDSESLQQFGQVVASGWNMDQLYVGNPIPVRQCPNVAMLVLLPDAGQVRLSSASCEFICEENAGHDVAVAVMSALKDASLVEAVLVGIRETYRLLRETRLRASVSGSANWSADGATQQSSGSQAMLGDIALDVGQRVLFAFAVSVFIMSILVGLWVVLLTPGLLTRRRK